MVNPDRVVNFKTAELRPPQLSEAEKQAAKERRDWGNDYDLTLGRRRHLLLGTVETGMEGYADMTAFRRGWSRHGSDLMKEWAHRVGMRPAGYWICDFPHELDGEPASPMHFGKVVPSLGDQAAILAAHDLLTDAELEAMGQAAQTV